jgi:hypothetical protein
MSPERARMRRLGCKVADGASKVRSAASVLVAIILAAAVFVAPGHGVPRRTACGVTLPNGKHPAGTAAGPDWYGNGKLFTGGLWAHGVILADPRFINLDGSIGMKFPWWGVGVPHKLLKIRGQRLDGPSRPLRARVQWGQPEGFRARSSHLG